MWKSNQSKYVYMNNLIIIHARPRREAVANPLRLPFKPAGQHKLTVNSTDTPVYSTVKYTHSHTVVFTVVILK